MIIKGMTPVSVASAMHTEQTNYHLVEMASKLHFEPSGVWGENGQTYSSLYLGSSAYLYLVNGSEVHLEISGKMRPTNVKTWTQLVHLVDMLATDRGVRQDLEVLQIYPGVYDIAPEREEVCND